MACCIFVLLCSAAIGVRIYKDGKYYSHVKSTYDTIQLGAESAESIGELKRQVWYDAIYGNNNEETSKYTSGASDFNEALSNLYKDESFVDKCNVLRANQKIVLLFMKDKKNPPEKYDDLYDDLKECFDNYCKLADLVLDSSGLSYNTYSESFRNACSEYSDSARDLEINLD